MKPSTFRILLVILPSLWAAQAQAGERKSFPAPPSQVAKAKAALAEQLKDPNSLKLKNVVLRSIAGPDKGILCGEFNAKNSYGGYVGFARFTYEDGKLYTEDDPSGKIMINAFCGSY